MSPADKEEFDPRHVRLRSRSEKAIRTWEYDSARIELRPPEARGYFRHKNLRYQPP